jgi:chromosome segregation ATPase
MEQRSIGEMKKYPTLMALAMIFLFILTFSAEAGKVYTWTDEHGNLHITNTPPPKNANIKEVLPYQQKTSDDIQSEKQVQKKEKEEDLKATQTQQIEEAQRKLRQADERAKEAVAKAEQIYQDNNAYIGRLGSTKEKRKQFKKRIQRLKDEAELAQKVANEAIEDARQAAEALKELEEEIAKANQQPQTKTTQPAQANNRE